MPEPEDFRVVGPDDIPAIQNHLRRYPPPHSDFTPTIMLSWQHCVKYSYSLSGNLLYVMTEYRGNVQFRPPLGDVSSNVIEEFVEMAMEYGGSRPIGMVTPQYRDLFPERVRERFVEDRRFFDYVYENKELYEMKGGKYASMRNAYNRFVREASFELRPITKNDIPDILDFLERWCRHRGCPEKEDVDDEVIAMKKSLEHIDLLGLNGWCLEIDSTIEGVSIYEPMGDDMAVIHYEKAIPSYRGIYQAIVRETAGLLLEKGYRYMNRESDMGVDGLRRSKMSYNPAYLIKVWHLER